MIKFRNASKYYGNLGAVDKMNLEVLPGEIFALIGPNGSGKTTALRMAAGLIKPTIGNVTYLGESMWRASPSLKSKLTFLPQRVHFPDALKLREVIGFYAQIRRIATGQVKQILEMMSLEVHREKKIAELSGGMVQRLGLAVSFMSKTPMHLLDEPTLNLDPQGSRLFKQHLRDLRDQGRTILFSSHILQDIEQVADRVGIMVNGKLVDIQNSEDFVDLIHTKSLLTVTMGDQNPSYLDAVVKVGALSARYVNSHMEISVPPAKRFEALKALQEAGVKLETIGTIAPSLEQLLSERFEQ